MIRWYKRWLHRRDITRRLIAFAKTPEGHTYLEQINNNNLIMADYEAEILGAEPYGVGHPIQIKMPTEDWNLLNRP